MVAGLDFRSYSSATATLAHKGGLAKIKKEIEKDHKGFYNADNIAILALWEADGFPLGGNDDSPFFEGGGDGDPDSKIDLDNFDPFGDGTDSENNSKSSSGDAVGKSTGC
jgi:hypothetical protein